MSGLSAVLACEMEGSAGATCRPSAFREQSYHALSRQDAAWCADLARIGHDQALRTDLTAFAAPLILYCANARTCRCDRLHRATADRGLGQALIATLAALAL